MVSSVGVRCDREAVSSVGVRCERWDRVKWSPVRVRCDRDPVKWSHRLESGVIGIG